LDDNVTEPISVIIVDDHEVVRSGLRAYFSSQPGFNVVGEAASGEEAVKLAREQIPNVVLMDLLLSNSEGLQATRSIKRISPNTQIIVLTSHDDDQQIFDALKAGANGCIFKDMKMETLTEAIRRGLLAEISIHPRIATLILKEFQDSGSDNDSSANTLSDTEFQILNLLSNGYSIRKISEKFSIDENEVNGNLKIILNKLQKSEFEKTAFK
jgi:DNA-binding NarL/FixJ family response regulator